MQRFAVTVAPEACVVETLGHCAAMGRETRATDAPTTSAKRSDLMPRAPHVLWV